MAIGKAIEAADNLSDTTKQVYQERLAKMQSELKLPPNRLVRQPIKTLDWIKQHSDSLQTQKSYLAAILALFKYVPKLKEKEARKYTQFSNAFQDIQNQLDAQAKTNQPTQKQRQALISWSEIIAARDKQKHSARLLLAMYTYIPPLRSDFDRVYIYTSPQTQPIHPNYILLNDPTPRLVLHQYKTAKSMGPLTSPLPPELVTEIKNSLLEEPRDWLFTNRYHKPYDNPASFTRWANRTLLTVFNKPITISILRHIYISQLDFNKLSIAEKEDIGKRMGHHLGMQDRYRLIRPFGSD
jgi:integrase